MPLPTQRPSPWKTAGITAAAAAVGVLVFLIVRGSMLPPDDSDPLPFIGLMFLDFILGLTAVGLLPIALRRSPVGAGLAIIALSGLSTLALPAACLCIVRLAALRRPRLLAATALVFLAAVLVDLAVNPVDGAEDYGWVLLIALGMLGVLVLIGLNRGAKRALIVSLRQEADSARREQDARADQARLAERTRIAREMHDTLAHRLSLISMHAGALEYRTDLEPETIRSTAGVLRETAAKAASELRQVLAVLREEPEATAPQPNISAIPALVESARAAGTDITLSIEPALLAAGADGPADATSRHLYRVAQEGITNAQKHAPGHPVAVSLTGAPGEGITVTVSNPVSRSTSPAPDGLGLIGLAERARLSGGSFESGAKRGVYTTAVQVPW
ncbi:sensor histidine kinase [Arthrobacter sunyaminii]|uniref:histidine kinase n=1 Tax=Arthrobacter sunyaminii TaxID=2816859 RepID=A0A975S4M9_9MICC|nr:histidine kinase [Arthrobacter sunyaminii]MBO0908574.1 two-component sensor histidine kinase [Arthrobacter sunyaminii]QWQ35890.1 two-component sensor histidine kinase [Arthrobacter sunyaminii]